MAKKEKDICNPRCLVNLLHYEVTDKNLACKKCPLADKCKEYKNAKVFREV